jgi:hypothetical protein
MFLFRFNVMFTCPCPYPWSCQCPWQMSMNMNMNIYMNMDMVMDDMDMVMDDMDMVMDWPWPWATLTRTWVTYRTSNTGTGKESGMDVQSYCRCRILKIGRKFQPVQHNVFSRTLEGIGPILFITVTVFGLNTHPMYSEVAVSDRFRRTVGPPTTLSTMNMCTHA